MIPCVSIIVPVYNAEKFVERTIKSLLEQTEKSIEILLIDDGSSDRSLEICNNYHKVDDRITIISQENKGASAARNKGIEIAKGQYIMFCDADDVVSNYWVEHAVSYVEKNNDVLPICSYCHEVEKLGTRKCLKTVSEETVDRSVYYRFNQEGIAGYLWNALYRRDILLAKNIRLREKKESGDYNEDLLFALTYIKYVNKIVYTGYADYCYLVRQDSLSHSYDNYFEKYEEKYILWVNFIRENDMGNGNLLLQDLAIRMQYHFIRALKDDFEKRKYNHFSKIINSKSVNECVTLTKSSAENPVELYCIKYKKKKVLWIYWSASRLKQKIIRKDK